MPVLARAVREVESRAQRGALNHDQRTRFQVIGLLVREERNRVKADTEITEQSRGEQLKRLDGVATILAKTATRDPSLFLLLGDEATPTDEARILRREMLAAAGLAPAPTETPTDEGEVAPVAERRIVPQSVISRQLSNPFMAPDFSNAAPRESGPGRLSTWELLGPLFTSFEKASDGAPSCMQLPEPTFLMTPSGRELMKHQAQLVEAAAAGHRTFLLADEPGLGKTAQALLAAHAADAYPLLVVAPNVVKTNWAREVEMWTPGRTATVIHGNGDTIDGFADIVVINYEVLDRHVGWLGELGFRGMVVDEAHFIKNKSSQRSQQVMQVAERIRKRAGRPLMMALTGTPLINTIEDFRTIWQFLGWIDEKKPRSELMTALEQTGKTPLDHGFYGAARQAVIDRGIVRRRKVDVAADIPARRIADIPVDLEGEVGRSIAEAERKLVERMLRRYDTGAAAKAEARSSAISDTIDADLVRRVATWEREDNQNSKDEENVFAMMRRIGQAKAGLAADYTAQLARNVGKVVFFAKHVDVMDAAEASFSQRGIRYTSIRGDQSKAAREKAIDGFMNDPEVKVIVCSVTAAGVGINLQVASDVVLAELSWTDAEQTQAIDRVHRIGQDKPVTAWRIIAAQTIDGRIAELIDSKAGLAARALDGSDGEIGSSVDVQLEALVALLADALETRTG
ncbi:DEAD/DEAH box helicase [Aeromicrobium sp. CF3.5]|uniref:DEAD/DEAH box helicase n=1 Tax=Aeromicrobium sp. CF3.5 TaxID=3373078 RepID=UPI003EE80219